MKRTSKCYVVLAPEGTGEVVLVCEHKEDIPLRYRGTHEILEAHIED